jgi:hypothetical protein
VIAAGATEDVRCAGDARLVTDPGRDDLRVDAPAQRRAWQDQLHAGFLGEPLGLLVEHHEADLRPRSVP